MTRKEAISHIRLILSYDGTFDEKDAENLINKIFDDFENRTCKNCRYYKKGYCHHSDICYWVGSSSKEGICVDYLYLKNFGCNKFEKK